MSKAPTLLAVAIVNRCSGLIELGPLMHCQGCSQVPAAALARRSKHVPKATGHGA